MSSRRQSAAWFHNGSVSWPNHREQFEAEIKMATELTLPKVGFSMTEGILAEWLVADGDHVTEGQIIFALESDKSTQEVESPATGTIRISAAVGETYPVGHVLGSIE